MSGWIWKEFAEAGKVGNVCPTLINVLRYGATVIIVTIGFKTGIQLSKGSVSNTNQAAELPVKAANATIIDARFTITGIDAFEKK